MRRIIFLLGLVALFGVFASQAAAATTTVSVSMTFTEPILQDVTHGCPVLPGGGGFCGSGIVLPFGHATETIQFGGACGGSCDFRTVNVAGGSIYLDEFFSDGICRGACHPNPAEPFLGILTDVIVGGTGIFTDASGNVSGTVKAAGPQSLIQLSGSITLTS